METWTGSSYAGAGGPAPVPASGLPGKAPRRFSGPGGQNRHQRRHRPHPGDENPAEPGEALGKPERTAPKKCPHGPAE